MLFYRTVAKSKQHLPSFTTKYCKCTML